MSRSAPSPGEVLEVVGDLAPPGTPLTTPEVATEFDCTSRTVYNKLEALVEEGVLETKKVGSRGRVWWRPPVGGIDDDGADADGVLAGDDASREPFDDEFDREGRFLDAILSNVDDYVYVWNREKELVYANESLEAFWGMADGEYLGRTNRELGTPPRESDRLEGEVERVFETGETVQGEAPYTEPADAEGYHEYVLSPIRGGDGAVEFVAGISRDATERREAEAAAAESTFRQLFENVPGNYLVVEPGSYEIVAVSDAYLESTMTEREAILGESLFSVFPADPADPAEGVSRLRDSLDRVETEGESDVMSITYYPIPDPDSEGEFVERWWNPINSPVFGSTGEIDYVIHRVEDVTPVVERLDDGEIETILEGFPADDSRLTGDVMLRGQELYRAKERAYERLRESERRYRTLFESIDEGFCVLERCDGEGPTDFRFVEANPAFEAESGVVDVVGRTIREVVPEEADGWIEAYREVLETGESIRFERELRTTGRILELYAFRVGDGSEGRVGVIFQDVTERKRTRATIERLNAVGRELIDADPDGIRERAPEVVRETLGVEYAALWRYDERGEIERAASSVDPGTAIDVDGFPEGFDERIWEAFVGGAIAVEEDLPEELPLETCALVPLGRHGVVRLGTTESGRFDETAVDLAGTVAATIEAALDRAEGERQLEDQNEELERLDRLNTLIRDIDQALVQADTLAGIDRAVCERLADADRFAFAWIGEYDPAAGRVEPREWAGIGAGTVEELVADEPARDDPIVAAVERRETQVVADVATDPRAGPWREAALERGGRSCLSIPLVYEESIYGVLKVYGASPRPDERDREVLAELGRTIAHAIHAVEARETRRTDSVVELTVRSRGSETPLARLSRETGCTFEVEGIVPRPGGPDAVFVTVVGDPEAFLAAAEDAVPIEGVGAIADREGDSPFRVHPAEPTLASTLREGDAVVSSLSIEEGVATAVVDLDRSADVRAFVEGVRERVPDLELLTRHTRARPLGSRRTFRTAYEDRLTARQEEVIRTAYRSGFFESPRHRTGSELSETLEISQSTFTHHLREAERKLCELLFDRS
ncbi:bacterio-opsin activator domain-containing protein [Saliphagus infecundisoli]|uniref:Bacterio-opsin activator domain-containing protein n=1 Tax=Saliphagus infecundisoli TaxID=1849069 RepID=A0ABD5QEV5_9EURY|nr:bacterio-opsin activator domain-containing protein [Saliphagus infecundisoli]